MSSKKRRQTMEKFRREQAVKQRRADKLQKKADARIARTAGAPAGEAGLDADVPDQASMGKAGLPESLSPATVEPI